MEQFNSLLDKMKAKEEYYLEVIGHGINKVTDKPINFIGK